MISLIVMMGKLSIDRIDLNDDGKPEYIINSLIIIGSCLEAHY